MPALQNFKDNVTHVTSAWLNQIDSLWTNIFNQASNNVQARTALFSDSALEISNGGTGARSAAAALANLGGLPVQTFTQNGLGQILNPPTPAELAAGINFGTTIGSIVNPSYLPGHVDRYGTNVPGTTPMAKAFQASINQARQGGSPIIWGETGPYVLEAPLDCTNTNFGLTFRQLDARGTNLPPPVGSTQIGSLWVKHNGYAVFDLSGCMFPDFHDLTLVTQDMLGPTPPTPTIYPQTCFFLSRTTFSAGSNARFHNCNIHGYFSVAILYNFASEVGVYSDNDWINHAPDAGAKVAVLSVNNYFMGTANFMQSAVPGVTVPLVPPALPQSTLSHEFRGGSYGMVNMSPTSDIFYIEGGVDRCRLLEFWCVGSNADGVTSGRSLLYNETVNGGAARIEGHGLHLENSITQPQFGYAVGPGVGAVNNWSLIDSYFNTSVHDIQIDASILATGFRIVNVANVSGALGLNAPGTVTDSWFDWPVAINIGNSQRNFFRNFISNITRGAHSADTIMDHSGVLFLDASLAVNGASPPGQLQGWGTPTGGAPVPNFPGSAATLGQCGQALSAIITYLKSTGYFGA